MSTGTVVENGDSGAVVRQSINRKLEEVDFADLAAAAVIDDDTGATVSNTSLWTSESIKAYVDTDVAAVSGVKSYTFKSKASNGIEYLAGYYNCPAADANLTNASLTVTEGTANSMYGGHVIAVAAAAGVTDGSDLVLTVSGTSITDAGVRTTSDSEVLVADCTASSTDDYYESSKKFIGQVVYTLSSTGGATFNYDFNYGFVKYDDVENSQFEITSLECVGEAGANDTGFNIQLLLHPGTGWTYDASAFVPGGSALLDMNVDYSTESNLINNEFFAYKRTGLSQLVDGTNNEGYIIRVTTTTNNAVDFMNAHIQFLFTDTLIT